MSIEGKRGCGYRKVGNTYAVSGDMLGACDRLPFELTVCPCCGEGYRPSRALRQIEPASMLGFQHFSNTNCGCSKNCPVCFPPDLSSTVENPDDPQPGHYLEWIGETHYKTPTEFSLEAQEMGISRRLKNGIPRNLIIGQTVIYLAHRKVQFSKRVDLGDGWSRLKKVEGAGIFSAFTVRRLEHLCMESEMSLLRRFEKDDDLVEDYLSEKLAKRIKSLFRLQEQGVILIPVPDDDPDHRK